MKPDAYLINTARGGIVDEDALFDALADRRIAGAALDCFAEEPVTRPHRFGDARQRAARPAQHRLDRRAVPRHRPGRLPGDARPLARQEAARRRQPAGLRPPRLPGEVGAAPVSMIDRARGTDVMGGGWKDRPPGSAGPPRASARPTARLFAEEGANVALADVQADRGEAVRDAIASAGAARRSSSPPTCRSRATSATRSRRPSTGSAA